MKTYPLLLLLCVIFLPSALGQGLLDGLGDALDGVGNALGGSGQPTGNKSNACDCSRGQNCSECSQNSKNGQGGLGNIVDNLGDAAGGLLDGLTGSGCKCPDGQKCNNSCPNGGLGNVVDGLGDALGSATGSVGGLVNGVGNVLGGVTGTVGGLLSGLTGALAPAVQLVLGALGPVVQGLLGVVDGVLGLVLKLVAAVVSLLLGILGEAGPDVSAVLGPLVSLLENGGAGQGALIGDILNQLGQGLTSILNQAGPDALKVLGPLVSLLESLGKQATNFGRCPCSGNANCGCPSTNNKPCRNCTSGGSTGMGNQTQNSNASKPSDNTTAPMDTSFVGNNLENCINRTCQVVCLLTGCTVDGENVKGTFQDLLMEAKNKSLGYAGTVTGLSVDREGLFQGEVGKMFTDLGFNPSGFLGTFGVVPDTLLNRYDNFWSSLARRLPQSNSPAPAPANTQNGCPNTNQGQQPNQANVGGNNNRRPQSNNNQGKSRNNGNQNRNSCPRNYQRTRNGCVPINRNNNCPRNYQRTRNGCVPYRRNNG